MRLNTQQYNKKYNYSLSLIIIEYLSIIILICFIKNSQQTINRRTNNACKSSRDCPHNAFCDYEYTSLSSDNGICTCKKDYIVITDNNNWECIEVANTLNDPCINNKQCEIKLSNDAECNKIRKICVCKENTHFVEKENSCYKSVKIGEHCKFSNNCIGEETQCNAGFCVCPYHTHSNDNFTLCLRDIYLNEECNNNDECVAINSICNSICRCKLNHVISLDGLSCIKVADQLNDECTEDRQCQVHIPNSICNKNSQMEMGNCTCRSGYHESNLTCFVSVELNGICETNENCHMEHLDVDCILGRCICRDGHFDTSGYCSTGHNILFYSNLLILFYLSKFLIF